MHILQPKHIILKKEEINKLLLKFNVAFSQLPKISKKDPIVPEEVKPGDVLRIERKNEETTEEYFRVVV